MLVRKRLHVRKSKNGLIIAQKSDTFRLIGTLLLTIIPDR